MTENGGVAAAESHSRLLLLIFLSQLLLASTEESEVTSIEHGGVTETEDGGVALPDRLRRFLYHQLLAST